MKQIADTIRRVGLDPMSSKPVGKYSLGMRQRLGIAQAIMEDPSLMILDEPMNGLDKNGVAEMRELFKSLATTAARSCLPATILRTLRFCATPSAKWTQA